MGVYIGQDKVSTYLKMNTYENDEVILSNLNITPSAITTTYAASQYNADGFQNVTVLGDENLIAANIKNGVSIFGIIGTMVAEAARLQQSTVYPSKTTRSITPSSGYDGFSSIVLEGVTSDIDPNIAPENIKAGVSILGIEGSLIEGTTVSGTLNITENGSFDVSEYANVLVNIPVNTEIPAGYVLPTGNLDIVSNGNYNIKNYETVSISVPIPSGYVKPSGSQTIRSNGTYDITSKSSVVVNVPVPTGYILPSGTQDITANGTYDIKNKESVVVNVVNKPEMTKTITPTRSTQTVLPDTGKVFSSVTVNPIPSQYIIPTGTTTVTTNGTYDVTNKTTVVVEVPGEIHKYYYQTTQPTNVEEGAIWFRPVE